MWAIRADNGSKMLAASVQVGRARTLRNCSRTRDIRSSPFPLRGVSLSWGSAFDPGSNRGRKALHACQRRLKRVALKVKHEVTDTDICKGFDITCNLIRCTRQETAFAVGERLHFAVVEPTGTIRHPDG